MRLPHFLTVVFAAVVAVGLCGAGHVAEAGTINISDGYTVASSGSDSQDVFDQVTTPGAPFNTRQIDLYFANSGSAAFTVGSGSAVMSVAGGVENETSSIALYFFTQPTQGIDLTGSSTNNAIQFQLLAYSDSTGGASRELAFQDTNDNFAIFNFGTTPQNYTILFDQFTLSGTSFNWASVKNAQVNTAAPAPSALSMTIGTIAAVPEPSQIVLAGGAALIFGASRLVKRRRGKQTDADVIAA